MLFKNILLAICLLIANVSLAQDKHFTQFYASPLTLNPALTGNFEGKYRVGAVYRDQWREVLENPYLSYAANLDLRLDMPRRVQYRDKVGVGMVFFQDKVGGIDFSTTQIALSAAYHKSLNFENTQYLSLGFQGGITQRNVNFEQLTFQDQFNGIGGYDRPTAEIYPENNFAFRDLGVGLNYSFSNRKGFALFAGAALHHVFQPNVSFYERENVPSNKLFLKTSAQVTAQIKVADKVTLSPRMLFAIQGPHLEANVGSNVRFLVNDIAGIALHVGSWVRPVRNFDQTFSMDALIALIGLEYNNVMLGISYDLNLQDASANARSRNALEVSVVYLGEYESEEILCPKF